MNSITIRVALSIVAILLLAMAAYFAVLLLSAAPPPGELPQDAAIAEPADNSAVPASALLCPRDGAVVAQCDSACVGRVSVWLREKGALPADLTVRAIAHKAAATDRFVWELAGTRRSDRALVSYTLDGCTGTLGQVRVN